MDRPWIKNYEKGVRANLDYPPVPMHQLFEDTVAKYPNNPATIFGNGSMDAVMTYAALNNLVNRFANALIAFGVKKGDCVAIYLPNCPQYVIAYYATFKIGAIVAPVNPLYTPRELEHQVKDAGAETIIVLSRFYNNVRQVRANTKLKNVIVTNIKEYFKPVLKFLFTLAKEKKEGHHVELDAGDKWFQDVLASGATTKPSVPVTPADTAVLMYTGGTTGISKAAELTHANVVANALQTREWSPASVLGKEVYLTALPLYHSYAMTVCMNQCVYLGGAMILIPNPRELESVMKAINKHKPTAFPGVPTLYVALANHPKVGEYDFKSIRVCLSGAAGLPVEVQTKFQDISGATLVEGYGLSEASPVTHANPLRRELNRIGTIGLPFPDTDCKLVDVESGMKEVGLGEPGELCIKGPQIMKGYWNRPDETAKTLREGWLYTGDIAVMDTDGFFRIVDRKKDMIIVGGFNVYPRDVEEVLYQHPKVLEAVVVGVPDAKSGEVVKAYVVQKPGASATVEELMEYCKENLTSYKRPKTIEFRDSLPKTAVGKILRRQLLDEEKQKAKA